MFPQKHHCKQMSGKENTVLVAMSQIRFHTKYDPCLKSCTGTKQKDSSDSSINTVHIITLPSIQTFVRAHHLVGSYVIFT